MNELKKQKNNLIIFDVCNTFVDTNSTFSYIDFLIKNWVKPYYKTLFHNKLLWYFYYILRLLFRLDFKLFLAKKYFKWLDVKEISILSKEYFKRYESKIFPRMLEIINNEKTSSKVIFLSSSINPPIDFLQSKFWVDWFSSKLEEKDWKYTWKVLQPLWWKKQTVFEEWRIDLEKYEKIKFYTDNTNDSWLIKYLNENYGDVKFYIVPYQNKKYWNNFFSTNKINYEFIF